MEVIVGRWLPRNGGLYDVHADKHEMVFLGINSFLLATDGGLYKTTDNAQLWEKIENIPTTQLYRVAYNPHEPATYYGGAQDNGTMSGNASTINAWERLYGGDGFQAVFHPTDETKLYVETQYGNIAYYDDNEGTWQDGNIGMIEGDKKNWDMPYFISANDPEVMFAGTDKVYRSVGHPAFWEPISDDLTDGNIYGIRYHTISELSESPLVSNKIYVGTLRCQCVARHEYKWRMVMDKYRRRLAGALCVGGDGFAPTKATPYL